MPAPSTQPSARPVRGTARWRESCTRPPHSPTVGSRTSPVRCSTPRSRPPCSAPPTSHGPRSRPSRPRGGGGSLVVLGSLLGKISTPYMSSYVTAKWGVHGLVRTLQIEARSTPGTSVSLVWPGGVDTPGLPPGRHLPAPPRPSAAAGRLAREGRPRGRPGPGPPASREPCRRGEPCGRHRLPARTRGVRPHRHAAHARRRALPRRGGQLPRQRAHPAARRRGPARPVGSALAATRCRRRGRRDRRPPSTAPRGRGPDMDQLGKGVVTVTREVDAPAQAVWDVLADGWFYATWVVGASRVRGVDRVLAGGRRPDPPLVRGLAGRDQRHDPRAQQHRADRARAPGQGLAGRRGEGGHHGHPGGRRRRARWRWRRTPSPGRARSCRDRCGSWPSARATSKPCVASPTSPRVATASASTADAPPASHQLTSRARVTT